MLVNIGIIIIGFLLLTQKYTVCCSPRDSFMVIDTMEGVKYATVLLLEQSRHSLSIFLKFL